MKISPCSHWQYPTTPPPSPPHDGLEIGHFVFQGRRYLLEPQGQLFTLGSWVLIQGCDDLKGRMEGEERIRGGGHNWAVGVERGRRRDMDGAGRQGRGGEEGVAGRS